MTTILTLTVLVLLLTLLLGLVQVIRTRSPAGRMLAAQFLGTTTVAMLLLLSVVLSMPALLDVALVFAMLAAVTLICFVAISGRAAS